MARRGRGGERLAAPNSRTQRNISLAFTFFGTEAQRFMERAMKGTCPFFWISRCGWRKLSNLPGSSVSRDPPALRRSFRCSTLFWRNTPHSASGDEKAMEGLLFCVWHCLGVVIVYSVEFGGWDHPQKP